MSERIEKHGLKVVCPQYDFIEDEALPGTGLDPDAFWAGFSATTTEH